MIPSIAALIARSLVGMCLRSVASLKYASFAAFSRSGSRKIVAPFTTGTNPDTCAVVGVTPGSLPTWYIWFHRGEVRGRAGTCAVVTCWKLKFTFPVPVPVSRDNRGGGRRAREVRRSLSDYIRPCGSDMRDW